MPVPIGCKQRVHSRCGFNVWEIDPSPELMDTRGWNRNVVWLDAIDNWKTAFFTIENGLLCESVVLRHNSLQHIEGRDGWLSIHTCPKATPKTCRYCDRKIRIFRKDGRNLVHVNADPDDSGAWRIDQRGIAVHAELFTGERWATHRCSR